MKSTELKKMIKDAVKEAIQEELKDILLEAVRSPKSMVSENVSIPTPQLSSQPPLLSAAEKKAAYMNILGETGTFTAKDAATFNPSGPIDPANGALPPGELGMDQIMGLLNSK